LYALQGPAGEDNSDVDLGGMLDHADLDDKPDSFTAPTPLNGFSAIPMIKFAPPGTSHMIKIDDENFYKMSLVNQLSDPLAKRITSQVLRVQGRVLKNYVKRRFDDDPYLEISLDLSANHIKSTDLIGALVRRSTSLCLCVFLIVGFALGSDTEISRTEMPFKDFKTGVDSTSVVAQALELMYRARGDLQPVWEWTLGYLCTSANLDTKNQNISASNYTVTIPARLVHIIVPNMQLQQTGLGTQPTWVISARALKEIQAEAWNELEPDSNQIVKNIMALPSIAETTSLPYSSSDGEWKS
jgi:hypothetical protein